MACLQTVSIIGGVTAIINTTYILYTLSSVNSWHFHHLPAQGVVIVLCAVALFGCLVTWVSIPTIIKNAQKTARRADPVTRANLLGLVSVARNDCMNPAAWLVLYLFVLQV